MPNPFPGMNPYWEDRCYWRDMHWRFIAYAAEVLQPPPPKLSPALMEWLGKLLKERGLRPR